MTPASGAPTNDECNSVKVYSLDPAGHLGVFTARPVTGCSYAAWIELQGIFPALSTIGTTKRASLS
jgi:hypothetical protein